MLRIDKDHTGETVKTVREMGIHDQENHARKPEPLMSVKELAEYLNVRKSWVYAQIREARRTGFPVIKVGKYRRFVRQDVMTWLANNTTYS